MGDALDAVLRMKALKQQRELADAQAIGQGFNALANNLISARQFQSDEALRQMQIKNLQSQIKERDEDDIIETSEKLEAQRKIDYLTGNSTTQNGDTNNDLITTEFDPLTGLPTKAVRASSIQAKANAKPLSGESATKFSGARQGVSNAQKIRQLVTRGNFDRLKKQFNTQRLVTNMGIDRPGSLSKQFFDMATIGAGDNFLQAAIPDDVRDLEAQMMLLAENQLRARTGAQAPDTEAIKEELRTFLRSNDTFESFISRLDESEDFLFTVGNEVRPGRIKKSSTPSSDGGKVKVKLPNGSVGFIPKGKLQTALDRGAKKLG